MHFASELFDTHPRFMQLKSMLLDFFGSEVLEGIHMNGVEHIISVTLAPTPSGLASATLPTTTASGVLNNDDPASLPKVHIRTYTINAQRSGTRVPRIELTPMGPFLDLSLRRHREADPDMLKAALRRPKLKKQDVEKGLGKRKKNFEVDEMGDMRGRLHVGKQDLSKLQTRKMKGLKPGNVDEETESEEEEEEEDGRDAKRKKS